MAWEPSKINSDHLSASTCSRQRVKRVLQLQCMANRPTSVLALPKNLLASPLIALLHTYTSWKPDSCANHTDAITLYWSLLKVTPFHHSVRSHHFRKKRNSGQNKSGAIDTSGAGTTLVATLPEPFNQESCYDP